jgi:hypothetical protein
LLKPGILGPPLAAFAVSWARGSTARDLTDQSLSRLDYGMRSFWLTLAPLPSGTSASAETITLACRVELQGARRPIHSPTSTKLLSTTEHHRCA